ncbi:MAG: hypothetical protein M3Q71_01320 [Chloroflexota bacterium]|nr:hypothetical protein [Chloroflexota bacterium]
MGASHRTATSRVTGQSGSPAGNVPSDGTRRRRALAPGATAGRTILLAVAVPGRVWDGIAARLVRAGGVPRVGLGM